MHRLKPARLELEARESSVRRAAGSRISSAGSVAAEGYEQLHSNAPMCWPCTRRAYKTARCQTCPVCGPVCCLAVSVVLYAAACRVQPRRNELPGLSLPRNSCQTNTRLMTRRCCVQNMTLLTARMFRGRFMRCETRGTGRRLTGSPVRRCFPGFVGCVRIMPGAGGLLCVRCTEVENLARSELNSSGQKENRANKRNKCTRVVERCPIFVVYVGLGIAPAVSGNHS
jgi:hypothetical protein